MARIYGITCPFNALFKTPAHLSNGRQCPGFGFGLLVFQGIVTKKERVGLTGV